MPKHTPFLLGHGTNETDRWTDKSQHRLLPFSGEGISPCNNE